jgi:hypothetical protein
MQHQQLRVQPEKHINTQPSPPNKIHTIHLMENTVPSKLLFSSKPTPNGYQLVSHIASEDCGLLQHLFCLYACASVTEIELMPICVQFFHAAMTLR